MNKFLFLTLMILNTVMFNACKSESSDAFVIDFDAEPTGEITLKFEDLVEDVKVVALETRDDLILSGHVFAMITSSYIIIKDIRNGKVQLFDKEGKFLRDLAVRGRGPNEFGYFADCFVHEKKGLLYLIEFGGGDKIMRVEMATGSFLEPYHLGMSVYGRSIDDAGRIIALPNVLSILKKNKGGDSLSRAYFIDVENRVEKEIIVAKRDSTILGTISEVIGDKRNAYYYNAIESDTLYILDINGAKPYKLLKLSDKSRERMGEGYEISLEYKLSDGFIFEKLFKVASRRSFGEREVYSVTSEPRSFLLLNKKNEVYSIKESLIDKLNIRVSTTEYVEMTAEKKPSPKPIPYSDGDYLHYCFDAATAIALLEQALTDEATTEKQRKEINALLSKIDEDDNHIVIYGKKK